MSKINRSNKPSKIANIDWKLKSPPPSPYTHISCIYNVHLMDPAKPSRPFPIKRFIGTDRDGTLEIGQTTRLGIRIGEFKRAVMGKGDRNTEGWTLGRIFGRCKWIRDRFGSKEGLLSSIRFSYIETDKKHLLAEENRAIDHYCSLHGEPPVLNGQVPGVTWRPRDYKMSSIKMPFHRTNSSDGQVQQATIGLMAPPPNPLAGISCIYAVHLMGHNDPSRPFPINRIAKTDPEGIMEIGQTVNLARRIREIRYAVKRRKDHDEWALFHHIYDICPALQKIHGPRKDILNYLGVTYIKTKPSLLATKEIQAINDYISLYGELPPMNSQIPGNIQHLKG